MDRSLEGLLVLEEGMEGIGIHGGSRRGGLCEGWKNKEGFLGGNRL